MTCYISGLVTLFLFFTLNAAPRLDRLNLLQFRDSNGKVQPVKTPADWQKRLKQCLATGLHFQLDFFDGEVIRQLREQGVPLACFTVNNIVDAQRLWEAGVNAVFTDYIERLRITP